jgi:hypothetical protein
MRKWNVYVYLNETIEADDQFEAEQKGLEMIGSDGIRAEEIFASYYVEECSGPTLTLEFIPLETSAYIAEEEA